MAVEAGLTYMSGMCITPPNKTPFPEIAQLMQHLRSCVPTSGFSVFGRYDTEFGHPTWYSLRGDIVYVCPTVVPHSFIRIALQRVYQ